ncbi:MAG: helix-turn-helix domain-containing protein [Proteobacteria bacterium]|nr:helix-turn-helix domain-containing protein [Pseudomonadota bacterium]MBU1687491.1 helix-turn-helix domain-containing protein [Pseudomonadota bacterium]
MEIDEFVRFRKRLGKTQKQLAELLGTSVKAIHSYEQGWRNIPTHVERQLYFLLANVRTEGDPPKACWVIKKCPPDRKKNCPAWEFHAGQFCWFINGTICECQAQNNWKNKIEICRQCEVMKTLLKILDQPVVEQE